MNLCVAAMKPHEIQEKLGLTRISDRWVLVVLLYHDDEIFQC